MARLVLYNLWRAFKAQREIWLDHSGLNEGGLS